jgi:PAS domain S-box-containing protein
MNPPPDEPRKRTTDLETVLQDSKERYRTLVESSHDWVWEVDSEGVYTYVGPQCREILGYEPQEIIGKTPFDLMPPEEARRVTMAFGEIAAQRKEFRRLENINVHKDGHLVVLETNGIPIFDHQSNFCGYRGMDRDITKRKQSEDALRKSEKEYRELHESMMDAYVRVGMDGRIIEFNDAYQKMLGYEPQELFKLTYADLTPEKWHAFEAEIVERQVMVQGHSKVYEKEYQHKDGIIIPVELRSYLIRDDTGNPCGLWAIVRNITERKEAEAELRERLRFETLLADLSSRFVNVSTEKLDAEIEEGQRRVCEFLGLEMSTLWELSGTAPGVITLTHAYGSLGVLAVPEQLNGQEYFPWCFQQVRTGKVVAVSSLDELPPEAARDRDGWRRFGVKSNLTIGLAVGGGPIVGALSFNTMQAEHAWPEPLVKRLQLVAQILSNALARQRSDRALRESEERFRSLVENATVGIYRTTPDGRILMANPTLIRMLGYADFEGLATRSLQDEGFEPTCAREEFLKRIEQEGEVIGLEAAWKKRDGSLIWVRESARAIRGQDGEILFYDGIVEDITKHKQAEEARQISESRFSEFFATLPEYCYMISPDGNILDVNPAACEALGYGKEELIGRPMRTIYAAESHSKMVDLFERWKRTGKLRAEEIAICTNQGERRTVLLNTGSVMDTAGNLLHSVSVQVDISERKRIEQERLRAEEALRKSEQHSRELVLHSPIAMIVTRGPALKIELANLKFTELFGYSIEEVPDVEHWWPLAYPDEAYREKIRAEWEARVERAVRCHAEIEPMEATVRCKNGSSRHIEGHFAPVGDTSLVSFVDLTHRERAEAALRESEKRFRLVANTAPVMIWMSGVDKLCTFFNQFWLEFTGRSLDMELGNGWTDGVYAEDLRPCWETYSKAFDRRESFQMEYRLRRRDGEYRWLFDLGGPRYEADGSFAGYIGSCIDVTERKIAEDALSKMGGRLIEAQEQERSRIARELHDDINQRVAFLAVTLSTLKRDLPASATEAIRDISKIKEQVVNLGNDIQALSHRLHSSKLEILGLSSAASTFCREFSERNGVQINYQCEEIPKTLPEEISLCLFRVLQEALQNATKHSGSRSFQVSLNAGSNEVRLSVRDSGVGFNVTEAIKERGLGLVSMKERLKLVNGELSIDSQLHRGTTIQARVPLDTRAARGNSR